MRELATLVEGFFAGCLLRELISDGGLSLLRRPSVPTELAIALGVDEAILRASLEFLVRTTGAVQRTRSGRYCLGPELRSPMGVASLTKFLGAYGPPAWNAGASWRSPRQGARLVDRKALASAFSLAPHDPAAIVGLVRSHARTGVLDLGSGTGSLLAQVCVRRGLSGWGIDEDPAMCRAARRMLRARGLSGRVRFRCGDAARAGRLLSSDERGRVDVIHAASLFNALMRPKHRAVGLLRSLRRAYPGRTLVNVDYLSVLGSPGQPGGEQRGAALQDLAQVLTGQGIPPGSHDDWALLYRDADCRLTDVVEVKTPGLRWFVHTVTLE